MSQPLLSPEPEIDPDAKFRNWMRINLARAAAEFGLMVTGQPVFGWRLRTIGATARAPDGDRWLRVVSEEPQWAHLNFWTGNHDANSLTGIPKPAVLETMEWTEGNWRRQRAEVMTLLPGLTCSPSEVLRDEIRLTARWWRRLRYSIDTLSGTRTRRVNADQDKVSQRIHDAFGNRIELTIKNWVTVHGDLHWANLLQPQLGILDWELWGQGPAGTDAATLLCHSLLAPKTANLVREVFSDVLNHPDGIAAQLYVVARLLHRIKQGDYPDLAEPLKHHANTLLQTLGPGLNVR